MKPTEAAARALHDWMREQPEGKARDLKPWDETTLEAREQYVTMARLVVKAHKAAKQAEKAR